MADFTKTISNTLSLFGEGPATKWGQSNGFAYTMVWGTTKWGEASFTMVFSVDKLIDNSITPDTTYSFENQKLIENSFTVSGEMYSEQLSNGVWNVVFPNNTTNAEERDFVTWTESTSPTTSFTCLTAGSTTWS